MKKLSIIFLSVLTVLFFLSCNSNYSAPIPVTDIVFELELPTQQFSLSVNKAYQLNAKVKPDSATNKMLAYTSSAENIAAVSADGIITAKAIGSAKITVKATNGLQKTIDVTVTPEPIPVEDIEIEAVPVSLFIGETYSIKAKAQPNGASDRTFTYTVDNNNAYVAYDGTITAQSEGIVNITVKSQSNPEITKTVTITIKQKPVIELIKTEIEGNSDEESPTFTVKTLHGKLHYTPEIVGDEKEWLNIVRKDTTTAEEDIIYLKAKPNKTVWGRTAYIRFKGIDNKYIKGADGNELEVAFIQKENKNPIVTIKWVDGIGEPSPSEKKKGKIETPLPGQTKKFYWDDDKIFWWYEGSTTKWFNNRKLLNLGVLAKDADDRYQCWAKTASNMLHWWFVQNETNIKKYIKNKSPEEQAKYQDYYNRDFPNEKEKEKSFIANTFRVKAHNGIKGDYIIGGLSWYLYGNATAKISRQGKDKKPLFDEPALFKDVFSRENTPIERKNVYDKASFNEIISSALKSKKAIGIDIWGSKGKNEYGHAITLWGAAFDEEENILAIYVVDNNFKENRIFPYGIYYKEGKPYLFNYGVNDFVPNRYVGQVTTLDKGEKQWQEWFDAHPEASPQP